MVLASLLGEADILAGQILCPRSVPNFQSANPLSGSAKWIQPGVTAYSPQTAWLQNATIKQNILFGSPYDANRYEACLAACSLTRDLEILEDGDETEIGEKGLNISGGKCFSDILGHCAMADDCSLIQGNVPEYPWQEVFTAERRSSSWMTSLVP